MTTTTDAQLYPAYWPEGTAVGEDGHAVAGPPVTDRGGFVPYFIGTFIWSLGTAFSHFGGGEERAQAVSSVALGLAIFIIGVTTLHSLYAWVQSLTGWLIALHGFAALMSGLVNEAHPLASVRYLLLIPAISVMIAAVKRGERAVAGARAGITLGGTIFCLYQFSFLDFSSLLNPQYRAGMFLNANGVGFIAAMTGISLLDYALVRYTRDGKLLRPGTIAFLGLFAVALLLCIGTKSRTATLVALFGSVIRVYLLLGPTRTILFSALLSVVAVTVAWDAVAAVGERAAEVFQLNDRFRGVDTGTGRYAIWAAVVEHIWLPNPFLGVGPARHLALTEYYAQASSAHNGLLAVLADTGLVGAVPLVIIVGICINHAFKFRRAPRMAFAITLLACGLLESVAEMMFFSIGNPASLFFLLSVAVLSVNGRAVEQLLAPVALPGAETEPPMEYSQHGLAGYN